MRSLDWCSCRRTLSPEISRISVVAILTESPEIKHREFHNMSTMSDGLHGTGRRRFLIEKCVGKRAAGGAVTILAAAQLASETAPAAAASCTAMMASDASANAVESRTSASMCAPRSPSGLQHERDVVSGAGTGAGAGAGRRGSGTHRKSPPPKRRSRRVEAGAGAARWRATNSAVSSP